MVRPRVLIIEDNPTHQRLISLMCQKHGASPVVVARTDQALREIERSQTYSAVLVDLGVPRSLLGRKCLAELGMLRSNRNLNFGIVAVTAHAMDGDRAECMRQGADDYISKPFTSHQFGEMLKRWTDYDRRLGRKAS